MCLCRVVRWLRCHLFFQSSDKINFSWRECRVGWRGGRSIWRYGMPLSLKGWGWGGGHSMDMHTEQGDRCQKEKVRKKKNTTKKLKKHTRANDRSCSWHPGVAYPWQAPAFPWWGRERQECESERGVRVNVCLSVCVRWTFFSAASAPWRCLSVAKGPQPWPRISRRAVSTQHFP